MSKEVLEPVEEEDIPPTNFLNSQDKFDIKSSDEKRFAKSATIFLTLVASLLFVYMADLVVAANGWGASNYTENVIDILKTLLISMCGYLFAKKLD